MIGDLWLTEFKRIVRSRGINLGAGTRPIQMTTVKQIDDLSFHCTVVYELEGDKVGAMYCIVDVEKDDTPNDGANYFLNNYAEEIDE